MKISCNSHFENTGGVFTLIVLDIHWGNRVIGVTLFNITFELEY